MAKNTSNPVPINGTGADSKNQVIFTKVLVFTYTHRYTRDEIQKSWKEIVQKENENLKQAMQRIKNQMFEFKLPNSKSPISIKNIKIVDAVKINSALYVDIKKYVRE